jgi:hypothetical protein
LAGAFFLAKLSINGVLRFTNRHAISATDFAYRTDGLEEEGQFCHSVSMIFFTAVLTKEIPSIRLDLYWILTLFPATNS